MEFFVLRNGQQLPYGRPRLVVSESFLLGGVGGFGVGS